MRVDDRLDIFLNVPLLFALVMQGDRVGNYRIKDILDVRLQSASDAYAQVRNLGYNKIL